MLCIIFGVTSSVSVTFLRFVLGIVQKALRDESLSRICLQSHRKIGEFRATIGLNIRWFLMTFVLWMD